MTDFGPPIPHVPGKPCPFPTAYGFMEFVDGETRFGVMGNYGMWESEDPTEPCFVTSYCLPAEHHAYGPRKSRMDREPDGWANHYNIDGDQVGLNHDTREEADDVADLQRIGIWRIYLKEKQG